MFKTREKVCRSDFHPKADRCESKKKHRLYAGFMDLEKAYDRVNSESLWEMLRMYDVGVNF